MVDLITITVVNATQSNKSFFFYMGQAQYIVSGLPGAQSLTTATVAPLTSGGSFTLQLPFAYCAAAQKVSGGEYLYSAIQQIALSAGSASVNDSTQMSINPIALAPPMPNSSVPVGAFEIVVPSYDSNSQNYYVGTGLKSQSGLVVLTSYILASPASSVAVTPSRSFYVALGTYAAGQTIPSQIPSYGRCDASASSNFKVTYNPDGTFTVESFADTAFLSAISMLITF
jgi:hypothetical protein